MGTKEENRRLFLSTYLLHKDNRIRLPKIIGYNLDAIPGETYFDIYFDVETKELILKLSEKKRVKINNEMQHH